MSKYLAIAGHGSGDSGATGLISKGEYRYMKENLFPEMMKYSKDITYFSNYNVYQRGNIVALARKYGLNVIEFHYDSFDPSVRGGHVIIHSDYQPDSMDLRLVEVIGEYFGKRLSFRGISGLSGRSGLANMNRTRNAGITYRLIELGNSQNHQDVEVLMNRVGELAHSLVQAITGGYTVKPKPTPEPKPKPKPKPAKLSFNEVVKRAKRGDYGNYPERESRIERETPYSYQSVQDEINRGEGLKQPSRSYKYGDRVRIKSSAKNYYTGENIPDYVKNKTHTIIQVKHNRVLLREIFSWIYTRDLS